MTQVAFSALKESSGGRIELLTLKQYLFSSPEMKYKSSHV
jgi:hypothetical protein